MLYIGTSGWQYRHWRETFYPKGLKQPDWLGHYCRRFQTVEINNTFYNLPEAPVFSHWKRDTPDDFVVAVKMSRFLTHIKRLKDPEEPVERFLTRARRLGRKLGPILIQLPPRMKAQPERLRHCLSLFRRSERLAVEFRDDSWYTDEVREILAARRAALVLADRRGPLGPAWKTADWGFVRFHEGAASPSPCYGETALETWVERIARLYGPERDVFCFFNNDTRACALRDAVVFARLARKHGFEHTRVPDPGAVRLAG